MIRVLSGIVTLLLILGCIDEIVPDTSGAVSNILVVEATVTNESKTQTVKLSSSRALNIKESIPERAAQVLISNKSGQEYTFSETQPGTYLSDLVFAAQVDEEYKLRITTSGEEVYESDWASYTGTVSLDTIYAERIVADDGRDGIAIYASGSNSNESANASYYRFEYEETFKIIAPLWTSRDLVFEVGTGFIFEPRPEAQRICYRTESSTALILANTTDLNTNNLTRFIVRFIPRNNYILSHRYSILVKQFAHSSTANNYFEILKDFSSSESILSDTQPGYLEGNIFGVNSEKQALGYFEVASVSEQRLFFNYTDFYGSDRLPDYIDPCHENEPDFSGLTQNLERNTIKFLVENTNPEFGEGPYIVVARVCGDCTALGTTEIPDFWEE